MEEKICPSYVDVIFVQETQFFAAGALSTGHTKVCESSVSAIEIFPELNLHPTNKSPVNLVTSVIWLDWGSHGDGPTFYLQSGWTINLTTSLMSSMSASDRMTVSLPLPSSVDSSILCTAFCFFPLDSEAELHLLLQKGFICILMLN